MGRLPLPIEVQQKIRALAAAGMAQRAIARELNLVRTSVFNVLNPEEAKRQRQKVKKYSARIIALDREEIPEGWFNIHDREDWLTG